MKQNTKSLIVTASICLSSFLLTFFASRAAMQNVPNRKIQPFQTQELSGKVRLEFSNEVSNAVRDAVLEYTRSYSEALGQAIANELELKLYGMPRTQWLRLNARFFTNTTTSHTNQQNSP